MPFALPGTMRRYMVTYAWQLLKKELVRRGKGPGREEQKLEQTGVLRKVDAGMGGVLDKWWLSCTFWSHSMAQRRERTPVL